MKLIDLFEAPIIDFGHLGDFDKPGPFRNQLDKKLVTHPLAIEKVYNFFKNTEWDIRIFVCNKTGTGKFSESGPVNHDQLIHMFGAEDAARIENGSDGAITIIYVGNDGAERMPLTPWMMAHRMGHAIAAERRKFRDDTRSYWEIAEKEFFKDVNYILVSYYGRVNIYRTGDMDLDLEPEYCALFNAIGTQFSSKSKKIKRPYEFLYESFAQYLNRGSIEYQPIPISVSYGSQAWGRPTKYLRLTYDIDQDYRQELSDMLSNNLEANFRNVMSAAESKIFVM